MQSLLLLLHPFNGLFSRTTWISQHQKVNHSLVLESKLFWILMKQEVMGWQWHRLNHMKNICTMLQTNNHASTSQLSFYWPAAFPVAQPSVSKHWTYTTSAVSIMRFFYFNHLLGTSGFRLLKWHSNSNKFGSWNLHSANVNFNQFCHISVCCFR